MFRGIRTGGRSWWLGVVLVGAALAVQAQPRAVTLTVQGEGESPYEAQADASRQALMQVLPQLVAVDRSVVNDDLKESVLSSSMGYITGFRILKRAQEGGHYTLTALVSVSPQEILSFDALRKSHNESEVSGITIMSEIQREKAQNEFLNRYMTRAFNGFPESAVEYQVKSVARDRKTPGSERFITVTLQQRLNPGFVRALESMVKAVSCSGRVPVTTLNNFGNAPDYPNLRGNGNSSQREAQTCGAFNVAFARKVKVKGLFSDSERWAEQSYALPANEPDGYDIFDLLYDYSSKYRYVGKVIDLLFMDASGQVMSDPSDPKKPMGLELQTVFPALVRNCYLARDMFKSCTMVIPEHPLDIDVTFDPESWGDAFNRVASVRVVPHLREDVDVRMVKHRLTCNQAGSMIRFEQALHKANMILSDVADRPEDCVFSDAIPQGGAVIIRNHTDVKCKSDKPSVEDDYPFNTCSRQ